MDWLNAIWSGIEWIFTTMGNTYQDFFSMNTVNDIISNPAENFTTILLLVLLEGLLSADNALVLAIMVSVLPKAQQKKALLYGMAGAIVFRLIAVGLGTTLVKLEFVTFLGGAYLLYLSIAHFIKDHNKNGVLDALESNGGAKKGKFTGWVLATFGLFWATVIQVELMDIAFSVDSVLAAFGVSDKAWVIFLGGIMGVFMMRSVAKLFVSLIEKIPEFVTTAYALIILIGVKMIASVLGFHISQLLFFSVVVVTFLSTFAIHYLKKNRNVKEEVL